MTFERAKEILNALKEYERAYQYSKTDVVEALDIAIKGLETISWLKDRAMSEIIKELSQEQIDKYAHEYITKDIEVISSIIKEIME